MTPFELVNRLKVARISHSISSVRDGALMFEIAVPGERWEIEIFDDGHVEIERFRSDGEIWDSAALVDLFATFSG